jgi:hypothetical protein
MIESFHYQNNNNGRKPERNEYFQLHSKGARFLEKTPIKDYLSKN